MYKIIFISKDNQKFEFTSREEKEEKAIEKGFQKIEELGYSNYKYKVTEIKRIR